jgi:hypothetical protein
LVEHCVPKSFRSMESPDRRRKMRRLSLYTRNRGKTPGGSLLFFERMPRKGADFQNANHALLLKDGVSDDEREQKSMQHQPAALLGGVLWIAPLQGHRFEVCYDGFQTVKNLRRYPQLFGACDQPADLRRDVC